MNRFQRLVKLLAISASAGVVWSSSCFPDNFWADKWAEIVNRAIFGVINAALGQGGPI